AKYLDGLVEDVWWHSGRSPAYGEGISFWALGEMVRERCGLVETDDEATTRARVTETLARHVPAEHERRWIEPALLALLGIGDPSLGSEQLFGAWRTFFERLSASATVALVFEDFHYADSGLIDFVDHLLEWSRSLPILVVTLSRPELLDRRQDWGAGKRNFTSVYLEPLPEPAMRELLLGLVPGLPQRAVREIVSRADGIPLYAVETVRMLVTEGRLALHGDRYVPVGDLDALAVPETLTALIAARLDGLAPEDRGILSDAAVLGQSFTSPALAAVSGVAEGDLEARLRGLVRREILAVAADPRSPERGQYTFVQALIREVAYNTLSRRDRKLRHLAAARYFEAMGSDELAGALAGHYLAAQRNAGEGDEADALAAQARVALVSAAGRAAALGSHEQALSFLEQALSVVDDPSEEASLLERAASAAMSAGQYSKAETLLERAAAIHRDSSDTPGILRTTADLAVALTTMGRSGDAIAALDRVPEEAIPTRDAVAAQLFAARAAAQIRQNEYAAAVASADRALEVAERLEITRVVVDAMMAKAMALNQLDRRLEAIIVADGVARFAEARGFAAGAIDARNLFAFAIWEDDPALALSTVRGDLELAMRMGDRSRWARALNAAAWIAISTGEWDWAERVATEGLASDVEASDRARILRVPARIAVYRGERSPAFEEMRAIAAGLDASVGTWTSFVAWETALLAGRTAEAYRLALEAADFAPAVGADAFPAAARAALWAGDAGRLREVVDRWDRAMSHGRWPEADRAAFRGALAALDGRTAEAVASYQRSIDRYRSLGMPFELARIEVDMVVALGSDTPESIAAAKDAREILEPLGAAAYLARLDEALRRSGIEVAAGG
ncbi:MAG TPA: hypothetical protein VEY67_01340, partial [Candidatus Dormibacteraeota bacterium]|nr:hypothetical protein [Candidatus Dormibacteraeota bacterium]